MEQVIVTQLPAPLSNYTFQTDQYFTAEQKQARANEIRAERGEQEYQEWLQRAISWDNLDPIVKKSRISPYDKITSGTIYYDSLDDIPAGLSKDSYVQGKDGKWSYIGNFK